MGITKNQLKKMKELEFQNEVLVGLFRRMGYRDVTDHSGGPQECGKDLVMWEFNEKKGTRNNIGVVVKAVPITGSFAKTLGQVQTQICQCLNEPYRDPVTNKEQWVNECWVVTSKKVSKEAHANLGLSQHDKRAVSFFGCDHVWEWLQKYHPAATSAEHVKQIQDVIKKDKKRFDTQLTIGPDSMNMHVAAKEPMELPIQLETEDSKRIVEESMQRGLPAELKEGFTLKKELLPELAKELIGQPKNLKLMPLHPTIAAVEHLWQVGAVDAKNRTHYLETLPFAVSRVNQHEIEFQSARCQLPYSITLIFRKNGEVVLNFIFAFENCYAVPRLECLRFAKAFRETGKGILLDKTRGMKYEIEKPPPVEGFVVNDSEIPVLEALIKIQSRLKHGIRTPRVFSSEQANLILGFGRAIDGDQKIDGMSMCVDKKTAAEFNTLGANDERSLTVTSTWQIQNVLFEVENLVSMADITTEIVESDDETAKIIFRPRKGNSFPMRYSSWKKLPESEL